MQLLKNKLFIDKEYFRFQNLKKVTFSFKRFSNPDFILLNSFGHIHWFIENWKKCWHKINKNWQHRCWKQFEMSPTSLSSHNLCQPYNFTSARNYKLCRIFLILFILNDVIMTSWRLRNLEFGHFQNGFDSRG